MLDNQGILQLYENVLKNDIFAYQISLTEIKTGIQCLHEVYQKESTNLRANRSQVADYNITAHRCAYLHKYAAFHTAMVRDMMYEAIQSNFPRFYDLVFSSPVFSVCCLGGGPGTDVIGVLAALHSSFSYFPTSVTVVDYMINWSMSFESILRELGSGFYGAFGNNVSHYLDWRYFGANLLKKFSPDVDNSISTASLVTMIKFASAASCIDTQNMINNIFTSMKPGAILFFIDNDGGGYSELIMKAASVHKFNSVFGPIRHENYTNEAVKTYKFGYPSCCKSTVSVHVLQKPFYFAPNLYGPPIFANNPNHPVFSSPGCSNPPKLPLLRSPLTPYIWQPSVEGGENTFAVDECVSDPNNNAFSSSPIQEIPQHPRLAQLQSRVATPLRSNIVNSPNAFTPRARGSKKAKYGCLPVKKWRNNFRRKFGNLKARASSLLGRQKVKKSHPVFRL